MRSNVSTLYCTCTIIGVWIYIVFYAACNHLLSVDWGGQEQRHCKEHRDYLDFVLKMASLLVFRGV